MNDLISKQAVLDIVLLDPGITSWQLEMINKLPSAQPDDYAELKQEFIRMAEYIDIFLECADEQKETLTGFVSRVAEFMPWTERD